MMLFYAKNELLRTRQLLSGYRCSDSSKKEILATVCRTKSRRESEEFEKDFSALLLSLASAIRAGQDPLVALIGLGALFPSRSVVHRQLEVLKTNIEAGLSEEEAITAFGKGIRHPDLRLFITAFILSRRQGASLGDCLHRLVRVVRQRQSFRRKTKAALAMQKLSAVGIGLSAIAIGLVQILSNPRALAAALESPVGLRLLVVGAGLIIAGLLWMLRIGKTRGCYG